MCDGEAIQGRAKTNSEPVDRGIGAIRPTDKVIPCQHRVKTQWDSDSCLASQTKTLLNGTNRRLGVTLFLCVAMSHSFSS